MKLRHMKRFMIFRGPYINKQKSKHNNLWLDLFFEGDNQLPAGLISMELHNWGHTKLGSMHMHCSEFDLISSGKK